MGLFAFNRARREAAARDQHDADTERPPAEQQDADTERPARGRRRKEAGDDAQQRAQDTDSTGG